MATNFHSTTLQNPDAGPSSLFIPAPNQRYNVGLDRDTFVPNPALCSHGSAKLRQMYKQRFAFIGKIMGAGMRTSNPLGLDLPPLIWKRFLGEEVTLRELADVDERFVRALQVVRQHDNESTWPHVALTGSASVVGCAR
jgi:hypothetical protein